LAETDFQGKRVVPFATHGGELGYFFADFENQAKMRKF
jgi:hypothetical protein